MSVGYPDGQRVDQSQLLDPIYQVTGNVTGNQGSPWIYAGNFETLLVQASVAGQPISVVVQWAADAAGAQPLGTSTLMLDTNITFFAEALLPLLGPFLRITLVPTIPANAYQPTVYFFLADQSRARALTSPTDRAFEFAGNINAAVAQVLYSTGYSSGLHGLYCFSGNQGVTVSVKFLSSETGAYAFCNRYKIAASLDDYRTMIFPAGPIQVIIGNNSTTTLNTGVLFCAAQDR
jgi:hypothetical protein